MEEKLSPKWGVAQKHHKESWAMLKNNWDKNPPPMQRTNDGKRPRTQKISFISMWRSRNQIRLLEDKLHMYSELCVLAEESKATIYPEDMQWKIDEQFGLFFSFLENT